MKPAKKNKVVGNFILDQWVNKDYRANWLRRINYETETDYVSDVQRYVKDWKIKGDNYEYVHVGKWARRYRKTKDGGFKSVSTKLSNPDGKSILSLVTDLKTLKCKYTFEELFNTDLRNIQNPEAYPLKSLLRRQERNELRKTKDENLFLLRDHCYLSDSSPNQNAIMGWDAKLVKYLEEQFGVPVYDLNEKVSEWNKQSKLTQSGTYFHITHFGGEKKSLTRDENDMNRTIMFWLFDDKLIFQYEEGRDTQ